MIRIYVLRVQEHLDSRSKSPLGYMIRTFSCKIVNEQPEPYQGYSYEHPEKVTVKRSFFFW